MFAEYIYIYIYNHIFFHVLPKKKRSSEIAHIHCFNTLTAFLLHNIKIYALMYHAYDVLRMHEKDESISLNMYWLIAVRTILSSKLHRGIVHT